MQGPEIRITLDTAAANAAAEKFASQLDAKMQKSAKLMTRQFDSAMNKTVRLFNRGISSIRRSFTSLATVIGILFGQRLVGVVFNTINQFAALENIFASFSINTQEAGAQMDFLINKSKELGFNVVDLADSYKKMFVAGRLVGFTSEKLQEIFASVAEAGAVAGMSSRQLEGAMRALHQMMSKGKVQAEELRGQLGEHLPGAFELAAKAVGVTTKELDKMLEQGKLTAIELFQNFPRELRNAYGPGLEGALRLPRRELERLKNDLSLIIKDMDAGFIIVSNSVLRLIRNFTQRPGKSFIEVFEEKSISLATTIEGLPAYWKFFTEASSAYLAPLTSFFAEIMNSMLSSADSAMTGIMGRTATMGDFFKFVFSKLPVLATGAFSQIQTVWSTMITAAQVTGNAIGFQFKLGFDQIILAGKLVGLSVKVVFQQMGNMITTIVNKVVDGVNSMFGWVGEILRDLGRDEWADKIQNMGQLSSWLATTTDEELKKTVTSIASTSRKMADNVALNFETMQIGVNNLKVLWKGMKDQLGEDQLTLGFDLEATDGQFNSMLKNLNEQLNAIKASNMEALKLSNTIQQIDNNTLHATKTANFLVDEWKLVSKQIEDSFANSMTDMFINFVNDGKKSFRELAKDAIENIQRIIFQELVAERIAKSLTGYIDQALSKLGPSPGQTGGGLLNALQSMFGFGGGVSAGPNAVAASTTTAVTAQGGGAGYAFMTGFAKGGVMTPKGAVPVQKYSNGGVATSPQLALFGEGRMNEAYVPLPDGKSIPVSMRGGGQTINNVRQGDVTINIEVNANEGTITSTQTGNSKSELNNFAKTITGLVQKEINRQLRPGGALTRG